MLHDRTFGPDEALLGRRSEIGAAYGSSPHNVDVKPHEKGSFDDRP